MSPVPIASLPLTIMVLFARVCFACNFADSPALAIPILFSTLDGHGLPKGGGHLQQLLHRIPVRLVQASPPTFGVMFPTGGKKAKKTILNVLQWDTYHHIGWYFMLCPITSHIISPSSHTLPYQKCKDQNSNSLHEQISFFSTADVSSAP